MESITLEDARRVIAGAEVKAQAIGQPMNIAVVGDGGNLRAHVRMDGAFIGSIAISINKAYTAIAFQTQTKDLAAAARSPGSRCSGSAIPRAGASSSSPAGSHSCGTDESSGRSA